MIRLLLVFLPLAALALLIGWATNQPGSVALDWFGANIAVHPTALLAAILALIFLAMLLTWLWVGVRARARLFRAKAQISRMGDAQVLAGQALAALMVERRPVAEKLSRRALRAAPDNPVALYVAGKTGDDAAILQLEDNRRTSLLGALARGMEQISDDALGDLLRLAPDSLPAWRSAYLTRVREQDFAGAISALDRCRKLGEAAHPPVSYRQAGVAYQAALAAFAAGEEPLAEQWLHRAVKTDISFAPAVAALARHELGLGKERRAGRLLRKGWAAQPHPDIARVFIDLNPTESAQDRLRRIEQLTAANPDVRESRLRRAQALIGAGDAKAAQTVLAPLLEEDRHIRSAQLAAYAIDAAGDGPVPSGLQERMLSGEAEPDWKCGNCGHHSAAWLLVCPSCGDAGAKVWQG